jgi:competence protein ComEA
LREAGIAGRLLNAARASSSEVGLIAVLGLSVVGAAALVWVRSSDPPAPPVRRIAAPSPSPSAVKMLVVHVSGQVSKPGVYSVPDGSRVQDAIVAAGGPTEPSDSNALNLAAPIVDGQKITVPKPGEAPVEGVAIAGGVASAGGKTNLNTASQAQLEELPGIGPVLAERIMAYRQTNGSFRTTKQLLEVSGFGPKRYESLKDLITV